MTSPLLADRVQETTTTTGTGTLTLGGATTGCRTFNSAFSNGNVVYYTIDDGAGNYEVGSGTVGTGTLTRDTVYTSSNSNAKVSFGAGTKNVYCDAPANVFPAGNIVGTSDTQTLTNKTLTNPVINGFTGDTSVINVGSGQIYKDTSGNVGIGTGSPSAKLDIAGSGRFVGPNSGTTGAVIIRDDATNASTGYLQWVNNSNASQYAWVKGLSASGIAFGNNTGEVMRLDSSGNLLLNGTSALGKFTVTAPTGGNAITMIGRSSDGYARFESYDRSGTVRTGAIAFFEDGSIEFSRSNTGSLVPEMTLDASGNLGVGTTSPYQPPGGKCFQLTGTDYSVFEQSATTSTSGYANWRQIVRGSVGGHVWQLQLMNDANSAEQTIYEVSRAANVVNYQRWFAGTSEAARIDSSGNFLVGTTVGLRRFTVSTSGSNTEMALTGTNSTGTAYFNVCDANGSNGGGYSLTIRGLGTSGSAQVNLSSISVLGTSVYNGSNTTTWNTTSDQRIKKNIVDSDKGLEIVNQIRVRNFEYRTADEIIDFPGEKNIAIPKSGVQIGVIAQELQEVLPSCVYAQKNGVLAITTDSLLWHMLKAIQELSAELNELKLKVNA